MALVGKRDGHNFGYGGQLSYAGSQALRGLFGRGHYGTVKVPSDRCQALYTGVGRRMGGSLMMRCRLIGRLGWFTPNTFLSRLNKGQSTLPPWRIGFPVWPGP